jgi:aspartyl protease family protein
VRRLFSLLLAIAAIVLFILLLRQDEGAWAELVRWDESSIETKIMALALAGIVAVALYRYQFSHVLRSAILWFLIAVALALGYTYRTELHSVADRVLAQFLPGRAVTKGRTVQIARGAGGSFSVVGQVNGARISMVLDTGASAVVLTHEAARAAGLPLEVLKYSVNVDTANGLARAAPVTLDRVSIGGLTERSVPALVASPGVLRTSLLGMSFLNRLESWEVRGDRLLLRGYP